MTGHLSHFSPGSTWRVTRGIRDCLGFRNGGGKPENPLFKSACAVQVKEGNPQSSLGDIAKTLGKMWHDLTDEQKAVRGCHAPPLFLSPRQDALCRTRCMVRSGRPEGGLSQWNLSLARTGVYIFRVPIRGNLAECVARKRVVRSKPIPTFPHLEGPVGPGRWFCVTCAAACDDLP